MFRGSDISSCLSHMNRNCRAQALNSDKGRSSRTSGLDSIAAAALATALCVLSFLPKPSPPIFVSLCIIHISCSVFWAFAAFFQRDDTITDVSHSLVIFFAVLACVRVFVLSSCM
jgi:hypothetical protein